MKKPPTTTRQKHPSLGRKHTEKHLGMPIEEWRQKKRQEWHELMAALQRFEFGAAYTPAGTDLFELRRAANRINEALQDDWICW